MDYFLPPRGLHKGNASGLRCPLHGRRPDARGLVHLEGGLVPCVSISGDPAHLQGGQLCPLQATLAVGMAITPNWETPVVQGDPQLI